MPSQFSRDITKWHLHKNSLTYVKEYAFVLFVCVTVRMYGIPVKKSFCQVIC